MIVLAERRQFGPSTQAIVDEALSRDIPWIRLNEHSLVQLGQGKYQQRIRATMTSKTSALAVDIAQDKKMTNRMLASAGLPVPRSEVVRSETDAVAAARRIGFPVVTKPLDGNHGRGVGLDIRTERGVRAGYKVAVRESRRGAESAGRAAHLLRPDLKACQRVGAERGADGDAGSRTQPLAPRPELDEVLGA